MRFYILILMLLCNTVILKAQVLNIESLRIPSKDSIGFAASLGANLNITKNTRNITTLGSSVYLQYKNRKHLAFFIANNSYQKIDGTDLVNNGTYHLRYNYKLKPFLTLEGFLQVYNNSISLIEIRQLAGGGPRFKLNETSNYKMYLGTLFMFEHEKTTTTSKPIYEDDFRFSGYFTFTFFPNDYLTFKTTTFYQPKLSEFSDYRINSYNSIYVKVVKNLAIKITYILNYDTQPAVGIPETQYELLNGVVYTFK